MSRYYLSFVEEYVQHPDFSGCIGGRVEVTRRGQTWPMNELRFLTRQIEKWEEFRDLWDGKEVSGEDLGRVEVLIEMEFQDGRLP